MKLKERRCFVCGGPFEQRAHVMTNELTRETKVLQRRQCALCGDTEFSSEQYTAARYRSRKRNSSCRESLK